MTSDGELVARLATLADDLGPLAAPPEWRDQLRALCATGRLVFGAAAMSVARVDTDETGDGLVYVAADGAGAAEIEGVRLPAGRGLGGFVAASGQTLAIDRVADDPRFAHDVAARTGYVPTTMLIAPIHGPSGNPTGVLSVLDRDPAVTAGLNPLETVASFAAQAALLLPSIDLVARLGPVLLAALAASIDGTDSGLTDGLLEVAATLPEADGELAATAGLLAQLRDRGPETRASVERVLGELLGLTAPRRRR